MKKVILSLSFFAIVLGSFAQSAEPATSKAELKFEKEVHDYGTIMQNDDGTCEFVFTNTGTEPLIISNARGSCGCTVPDWPRQPIAPGASESIKVKYATNRVGPINKSVTITSNASNAATKVIRIKGNVLKAPDSPVKENSSLAPTAN